MIYRLSNKTKDAIKSIVFSTTQSNFVVQSVAFKLRYRNVNEKLFKKSLSPSILNSYRQKWQQLGYPVETKTLLLSYNLSGIVDLNIIPENIFASIIEPSINYYKDKQLSLISTKNFYEKWFHNSEVFPKSYLHKIDDIFYDEQLDKIDDIDTYLIKSNFEYPLICKPSLGTAGGEGVRTISSLDELIQSLKSYKHLVIQEKIKQSGYLSSINPDVNSIRACLYRDLSGSFNLLNSSIRFGINGSLDNETAGGVVCNIHDKGQLNAYAVSKYCDVYFNHPNTGIAFSEVTIPEYEEMINVSLEIANQIPLSNLVSLDMCLDKDNRWRCIEVNLDNQTIRFSQYAGKGFFGKFTDEVIQRVLNNKESCI